MVEIINKELKSSGKKPLTLREQDIIEIMLKNMTKFIDCWDN